MAHTKEQHDDAQRNIAARDAQLGRALNFGLAHADKPAGLGAILGALATLRKDPASDEAFDMAATGIIALVYESPQEREAAHRWHALSAGCRPDEYAIGIVDLARHVGQALRLYRLRLIQFPSGASAIEAFRSGSLVPRFGERSPTAVQLQEWFAKAGQPKSKGGLTVVGLVARIIHHGRLLGALRGNLNSTRKRVDDVLSHRPKLLKW